MERHCSRHAGETLHRHRCRLRQLESHRDLKPEAVGNVVCASTPQLQRAAVHKLHIIVLSSDKQLVSLGGNTTQRTNEEERLTFLFCRTWSCMWELPTAVKHWTY